MFPIIQTKRVTLRPFQNDDFMNVSELITVYRQQNEGDDYKEIKTLDDVKKLTDNTVMISSTIYEKRDKKGSQSK
jgi:maltoporin